MAKITAQQNPDGGMQPTRVPLPHRDTIVSQQVGTLLAAANSFMAFIANTRNTTEDEPTVSPVDGGVKCAAEVTLIGICDRLDKIMSDPARWSMDFQDTLETQLSQLYKDHQSYMGEQRAAVRLASAPQARLSPQLLRIKDGSWIAFIGDVTSETNCVFGMGACVQEALDNFDRAIEGKPAGYVDDWIKKQNENEKQQPNSGVDKGGSEQTSVVECDVLETGHSGRAGAEPKSGRAKTGQTPRRGRSGKKSPDPRRDKTRTQG